MTEPLAKVCSQGSQSQSSLVHYSPHEWRRLSVSVSGLVVRSLRPFQHPSPQATKTEWAFTTAVKRSSAPALARTSFGKSCSLLPARCQEAAGLLFPTQRRHFWDFNSTYQTPKLLLSLGGSADVLGTNVSACIKSVSVVHRKKPRIPNLKPPKSQSLNPEPL